MVSDALGPVTGGYEAPCGSWVSKPGLPEEHPTLLTSEPCLQPPNDWETFISAQRTFVYTAFRRLCYAQGVVAMSEPLPTRRSEVSVWGWGLCEHSLPPFSGD